MPLTLALQRAQRKRKAGSDSGEQAAAMPPKPAGEHAPPKAKKARNQNGSVVSKQGGGEALTTVLSSIF